MGRAIDTENKLDALEVRLKLVEDALEELLQNGTRVHHVDLHDKLEELDKHESDIRNTIEEGVEVKPDEEFTPPAGKRKKTKSRKVESML